MTELHSYYALCPLIEQKSFLGVSRDKNEECVIVTFGRNVVNIYKLSDQKQIGGWTSRDYITSNVIYDTDQRSYVGVFNNKTIKLWKENSQNLDKLKKYKFPLNIHKVLPNENYPSTIIFSNGNCASLPYALDNHKTIGNSKPLLKDTDVIVDSQCFEIINKWHICYIVKNNKNVHAIITCQLREEFGDLERTVIVKEKLTRDEDVHVVGKLIRIGKAKSVFILWSDCKMRVYDLPSKIWTNFSTIPSISTFPSVSMACMENDHLIFFGNKKEQDGAIIVIYNTFLDVEFCKHPMKMYPADAKLYCYNSYIILETTNHIGLLYYTLDHVKSLNKKIPEVVSPINECQIYDYTTDQTTSNSPICTKIKKGLELQYQKTAKCPEDVQQLLEKNQFSSVLPVINKFSDKAPVMVCLIKYAIKLFNPYEIDVTDHKGFLKLCSRQFNVKEEKIREAKFEFLDYILQTSLTSMPYVINGLTLDEVLFLLTYISYTLYINEKIGAIFEAKLLDYCSSLIDGFFQQYLANKNDKVLYVLQRVHDVILKLIDVSDIANDLKPLISRLFDDNVNEESEDTMSYSIQLMEI